MHRLVLSVVLAVCLAAPATVSAAASLHPAKPHVKAGAGHVTDRLEVKLAPHRPVRLTSKAIPADANVELEVRVDHKTVGVAETEELVACGGTNSVAVRVVSRAAKGPATIYAISLTGKHSLTVVLSWST
jgi:hypothetical protein